MIFKSDLVEAINDLSHGLLALSIKVNELQKEVDSLKPNKVKVNIKPAKRTRGRPVGSKDKKPRAKKTVSTQPRDESGKFAKKK